MMAADLKATELTEVEREVDARALVEPAQYLPALLAHEILAGARTSVEILEAREQEDRA